MEQMKPRKFVALSEFANSPSAYPIMMGSWADCMNACVKDDAPCYVVEILLDEDGDEEESNDILFVNKAWNNKYVNR
jgi:hypothetical protein